MTTKGKRPYYATGLLLPYVPLDDEGSEWEWECDEDGHANRTELETQGYIFVKQLHSSVMAVQSVSTGELVVVKVPKAPNEFFEGIPTEFRFSTYAGCSVPLQDEVPWFPELKFWQRWGDGSWWLFFQYYNGGTMDNLINAHHQKRVPIPEAFIWHLIVQLGWAFAYLHQGRRYGEWQARKGWRPIYHRDAYANNVFLHYPPRRPGRTLWTPPYFNALPSVVLGDFGLAARAGDDPDGAPVAIYESEGGTPLAPAAWQDVEALGELVRRCVVAHVAVPGVREPPHEQAWRIDLRGRAVVRAQLRDVYSPALLGVVGDFEWDGHLTGHVEQDGNWETLPGMGWVCDRLLRDATARLEALAAADQRLCKLDEWDVSWTRPDALLPWRPDPDTPAGVADIWRVRGCVRGAFGYGSEGREPARPVRLDLRAADVTEIMPSRDDKAMTAEFRAERLHLVEPVWQKDTWDSRTLPAWPLARGFRRQVERALDLTERAIAGESEKMDYEWPPSESDDGVERETPLARPIALNPIGYSIRHDRLFRRLGRKMEALRNEISKYQERRDELRRRIVENGENFTDALAAVKHGLSDHDSTEGETTEEGSATEGGEEGEGSEEEVDEQGDEEDDGVETGYNADADENEEMDDDEGF